MPEVRKIFTADCSGPKEIDDGIFVERLDENGELYKVGVCVADTSRLYLNQDIKADAFARTTARYWDLPNGERGYDPMIDSGQIAKTELLEGTRRSVLIISFLVGDTRAPSDVDISFGNVEIHRNLTYKELANQAVYGRLKRVNRASECIRQHLKYVAYGDHEGTKPQWSEGGAAVSLSSRAWKVGSKMNESFMVAANHLVGRELAADGRPAIYRVHDPSDEQFRELLSASAARFSRQPGIHSSLNLDPYCRVTSPLRRLDDFVMNYQLRRRFLGEQPTQLLFRPVG